MKKPDNKPATTPNDQPKKSPVIIELTDDDLETVIGAARCPPTDGGEEDPTHKLVHKE